jgi:methylated-DNA-protein-cysteine methyltransferase-like protein
MDRPESTSRIAELWDLVRQVPPGRCTSYGCIGRLLTNPVSGLLVGKWMAWADDSDFDPDAVPWWRVCAADGSLVIARRDPNLGIQQRSRLEAEGVPFIDDRVDMNAAGYWFEDY